MTKKKIIIISALVVSLALLASLFYFFLAPKTARTIRNQGVDPIKINSFRGVLAGVLDGVKEEATKIEEKIEEAVTDPFSGKENKAAETPPPVSPGENNFTFAVLGDTQYFTPGNSKGNFQKAVASISKLNPDLVVQTGDLIRGCEGKSEDSQDYANWKNTLGSLASKTYAVQGNHDRVDNADKCDQIWQNTFNFPSNGPSGFSELAYSLDFKNSHFVFLDSNKPDAHAINSTQRSWLEQDLAKTRKKIFLLFSTSRPIR